MDVTVNAPLFSAVKTQNKHDEKRIIQISHCFTALYVHCVTEKKREGGREEKMKLHPPAASDFLQTT